MSTDRDSLPTRLYTAAQARALDRDAVGRLGIPGYTLMTRAGEAALHTLRRRWPNAKRIAVVCGSGNNAGDGYVLARLAQKAGFDVTTIALFEPKQLRGDALTAYRDFSAVGGHAVAWSNDAIKGVDVIVDAIFGTGLSRSLDAELCSRVEAINASRVPILALDVPSGINADTGEVLGAAIRAACTITFVGLKVGFYLGGAPDYVGAIEFDALDLASNESVEATAERLDIDWLRTVLPRRSRLAHKGTSGHVLIVGGGIGMAGAVRLSGEACLRVGAGLVTIATCPESVSSIVTDRPELIVRGVTQKEELQSLIERANAIAIGPGLGQDSWASEMMNVVFKCRKTLVVDADALNLLAKTPQKRGNWILTPHPGEAARLLQTTTQAIQANRLESVSALIDRYGGVAILKGANTWVADETHLPSVCDRGNPGMATPGMGDVLTGVVVGLLAQTKDPWQAARAGVFVHAYAGDRAAAQLGAHVERGLIASDLFAQLPSCVNPND